MTTQSYIKKGAFAPFFIFNSQQVLAYCYAFELRYR